MNNIHGSAATTTTVTATIHCKTKNWKQNHHHNHRHQQSTTHIKKKKNPPQNPLKTEQHPLAQQLNSRKHNQNPGNPNPQNY